MIPLRSTKRKVVVFVILGIIFATFFIISIYGTPVNAADKTTTQRLTDSMASVGTAILESGIALFGGLLVSIVSIIITVSEYNDFVNARAVVNGWVIVRDVANMFFIVILLIMAFGTILGKEEYHYKKILPKLLMMAVIVNFSRTLVGVMIDFAQVVMLTFVNGYKAAAGGNFASMFQIIKLMQFKKSSCEGDANVSGVPGEGEIFIAALLAFIMIMVSLVTVVVIVSVLILRIIMLWILTILSPVAFLMGTFPQGQKYYTQWWEEFKNQVMVGPVLAFFLWLSLVTVGAGDAARQISPTEVKPEDSVTFACSAVGTTDSLMSFIIGIMMLLAGVQMAQSMGGAISGMVSKSKGALRSGLGLAQKLGKVGIVKPVAGLAKYTGARIDDAQAGWQKTFAKSKTGKKILSGSVGDKLRVHGVQLRSLPGAWKARSERVAGERLGESQAVATDILNKYIGFKGTKVDSDYTTIARGNKVAEEMKIAQAGGTEKATIISKLKNVLEKDKKTNQWKVRDGMEDKAEALLKLLVPGHDMNELITDLDIGGADFDFDNPLEYSAHNTRALVQGIFGKDSQEAMRIAEDIGILGSQNNDALLYGMSTRDPKTGQRRWTTDKEQTNAAVGQVMKRGGRAATQNVRFQDIFREVRDSQGRRMIAGLSDFGKAYLKEGGDIFAGHWGHAQGEFKSKQLEGMDFVNDFYKGLQKEAKEMEKSDPSKAAEIRASAGRVRSFMDVGLSKDGKKAADDMAYKNSNERDEAVKKAVSENRDAGLVESIKRERASAFPDADPIETITKETVKEAGGDQVYEEAHKAFESDEPEGMNEFAEVVGKLQTSLDNMAKSLDEGYEPTLINPNTGVGLTHQDALAGSSLPAAIEEFTKATGEAKKLAAERILDKIQPQSQEKEYNTSTRDIKDKLLQQISVLKEIRKALAPEVRKKQSSSSIKGIDDMVENMKKVLSTIHGKQKVKKEVEEIEIVMKGIKPKIEKRGLSDEEIKKIADQIDALIKKL